MQTGTGRGQRMNIIFDVGNVLIRWDLAAAFGDHFDSAEAMHAYLDRAGFHAWNLHADGGRPWADNVADLRARLGDDAHPAILYPDRFGDTIRDPIEGTWALLDRLVAAGHAIFALTNFSAETWPRAVDLHPRLGTAFRDVVVSGRERMTKPDPAIYRLLLDRNGLAARDCLFIDDSAANVAGAQAVGMKAVRFRDPAGLERDLTGMGLL